VKRRSFLAAAGSAGLFVFFPVFPQEPEKVPDRLAGYPEDFNAYLHIAPDGRVGCFVGKVEMGQGNLTALAMLAAEELDVPVDRVDMTMGDTDLCPWDLGTFGSLSVWQFGPVLRQAAAEARAVLLALAGDALGCAVDQLRVDAGVVTVKGDASRRMTYGQLVAGRRIERHLKGAQVKPVKGFTLVGTEAARKDGRGKVTGAAVYAADLSLPGMLHACLLRPPAHGATFVAADTSGAEQVPGVRVLRDGDSVAVLHAHPDVAREALGRIKATWKPSPSTLDDTNIFDHLVKAAPPAKEVVNVGSPAAAHAVHRVEATYLNSYVAHAPLETHAATAQWEKGRMTVWASTQAPFMVRSQVAQALGLAPKDVRIITPYLGGGFGGKTAGPQAVEAARLARAAGCPVQVAWDRGEEFFLDTFRPAAVVKLSAGLDGEGRIASWEHQVIGAGDGGSETPYTIPHQRVTSAGGWFGGNPPGLHPFPIGAWRAPAANTNVFAREAHLDALAAKAGADPLAFRLRHVTDPRLANVLKAAAKAFGWVPGKAPGGRGADRGFGVACASHRATMVAAMAEVAVDRATGAVRVLRVVVAQDMGVVVNPDGARQQIEGCVTMGLSYALMEEVRFRDGKVLTDGFGAYPLPRFSDMPDIKTVLIPNPGLPAQGCGEPAIIVMGALVANAIHDAVGVRLLQLPMTPERVKAALKDAAAAVV
jgi:isoquinoline 1-oxidoreductase